MPEPITPDPVATPAVEPVVTPEPKDEFSGEGGPKALAAEREARKAAEAKIAAYEAKENEAAKANLSEVERAQAEAAEAAKARDEASAELARYKVAAKHGITDEDDLELLAAAPDEATMERLAARMASTGAAKTPKPDLSQGAKGSEKKASTGDQFADFFTNQLS